MNKKLIKKQAKKLLKKPILWLALVLNAFSFSAQAFSPLNGSVALDPVPGFQFFLQETSLVAGDIYGVSKRMLVTMTAYSSTPDQTDDSPFITASNTRVRDGIVASNFLPFKTKIMIPELFGNKVFTVEDRMHRRFGDRVDVWFADRATAARFGLQEAQILVLN